MSLVFDAIAAVIIVTIFSVAGLLYKILGIRSLSDFGFVRFVLFCLLLFKILHYLGREYWLCMPNQNKERKEEGKRKKRREKKTKTNKSPKILQNPNSLKHYVSVQKVSYFRAV